MADLPPLPTSTVLVVEVGSGAYGTGLKGHEDIDLIGVVMESPEQLMGTGLGFKTVMHRTAAEGAPSGPDDIDRTLYSLRTFLRLAMAGNPSILSALFAPVQYEMYGDIEARADEIGYGLRRMTDAFVGRHIIPRYRGYMRSECLRVLGLKSSRATGRSASILAHGYDTKSAMHAARLGFQGVELLDHGRMEIPMVGEATEWMRALRRGEIPFQEWWENVLVLDATLEAFGDREEIPEGPDFLRITEFSVGSHRLWWGW